MATEECQSIPRDGLSVEAYRLNTRPGRTVPATEQFKMAIGNLNLDCEAGAEREISRDALNRWALALIIRQGRRHHRREFHADRRGPLPNG